MTWNCCPSRERAIYQPSCSDSNTKCLGFVKKWKNALIKLKAVNRNARNSLFTDFTLCGFKELATECGETKEVVFE
jgi:hypothetical protein